MSLIDVAPVLAQHDEVAPQVQDLGRLAKLAPQRVQAPAQRIACVGGFLPGPQQRREATAIHPRITIG